MIKPGANAVRQGHVIGALLVILGVVMLSASFQIDKDPGGGWGARIFPLFGSGALVILGALEIIGAAHLTTNTTRIAPRIWPLLAVALIYVWLIGRIGYLLSTGLVAPLIFYIFGMRRPIALLAVSMLCPAIYHVIFFELLGVFPPYGEWIDLLDLLKG